MVELHVQFMKYQQLQIDMYYEFNFQIINFKLTQRMKKYNMKKILIAQVKMSAITNFM